MQPKIEPYSSHTAATAPLSSEPPPARATAHPSVSIRPAKSVPTRSCLFLYSCITTATSRLARAQHGVGGRGSFYFLARCLIFSYSFRKK